MADLPSSQRRRNALSALDLSRELRREICDYFEILQSMEDTGAMFRLHPWLISDVLSLNLLVRLGFRASSTKALTQARLDEILGKYPFDPRSETTIPKEIREAVLEDFYRVGSCSKVGKRFRLSSSAVRSLVLRWAFKRREAMGSPPDV